MLLVELISEQLLQILEWKRYLLFSSRQTRKKTMYFR